MSHFNYLPEFEKEFGHLLKRYRSLDEDIKKFERFILENPTGLGKNFTIVHGDESFKIIKARMKCESLKKRSIRVIYAYHDNTFEFMFIEIYFKGKKTNENRGRIKDYLKNQAFTA